VSAFVSVDGGKPTCLKFFSTGKVRCLKSDFPNAEEAQRSAQNMIDDMASAGNAGMPAIRLRDAKLNENSKDFTWSTRQNIDIRRLSAALRTAGIRAESDTSFGDSIMVVITPPGTNRQIKGQVLADGTVRLAGCRGDGELAANAVALSLNNSGALQGGPVDVAAVQCEVWLTKRSFQVCSEQQTINMDKLYAFLSDQRQCQSQHPVLSLWLQEKGDKQFIKSIVKVGTACPRLEIKFAPIVIDEWEQARRCKPEPVSISIHNKGEVQLAGNAEYKVLQAVYYLDDIISRHSEHLLDVEHEGGSCTAVSSRTPKRKLEVVTAGCESSTIFTPTPMGAKKQRSKTAFQTPATAVRGGKKNSAISSSPTGTQNWLQDAATPRDSDAGEASNADSAHDYHQRQLVALAMLRMCSEGALYWSNPQTLAPAPAEDGESCAEDGKAHRPAVLEMTSPSSSPEVSNDQTAASSPAAGTPKLAGLKLGGGVSVFVNTSTPKCVDLTEAESPPVSPTGLATTASHFNGRSTPVSPAKVVVASKAPVASKVRRRSKSSLKQHVSATGACMSANPHMLMGMTPLAMHQAPWMTHPWPTHSNPMHLSPWVATLANNAAPFSSVGPTLLPY